MAADIARSGTNDMSTMEDYVLPPWEFRVPEEGHIYDDLPGVDNDRDLLVEFYRSTGGDYWINNENWLSDRPLDEWHGVTAFGASVVGIDLRHNGLTGELPPEIGELVGLVTLDLSHNEIGGGLPAEMKDLVNMVSLRSADNKIGGWWFWINRMVEDMTVLETLDLSYNRFVGTFPGLRAPGAPSTLPLSLKNLNLSFNGFVVDHLANDNEPWGWRHFGYLLNANLFRLEIRGNLLDPGCVHHGLVEIPSHDLVEFAPICGP